jgi:hypothetical protein
MITGLALAAIIGFTLGLRCRAAMLLLSSMLVLLAACAAEWNALLAQDEGFWAMMRVWLYLAAHQTGFVAGSCAPLTEQPRARASAQAQAEGDGLRYDTTTRMPGG